MESGESAGIVLHRVKPVTKGYLNIAQAVMADICSNKSSYCNCCVVYLPRKKPSPEVGKTSNRFKMMKKVLETGL